MKFINKIISDQKYKQTLPKDFNEEFYLKINPDVSKSVQNGDFSSGADHYLKYGQHEQRKYKIVEPYFISEYRSLVQRLLIEHKENPDLALAKAIGAQTIEEFEKSGDLQVDILSILGLKNGMSIYDLACGCGRTAQALQRNGWSGKYFGADIIDEFVAHLMKRCPGYLAVVNHDQKIISENSTLDIIFSWSLFTHIHHEEIYLYMKDSHRALKEDGQLIFSFLEHNSSHHNQIFVNRVNMIKSGRSFDHFDSFIHRDFINQWSREIGFSDEITFIDGHFKLSTKGSFFQTIAVLKKS